MLPEQQEPAERRQQEQHDRDRGVAEELGVRLDAHDERGADHERGHHDRRADPVRELLDAPHQVLLVDALAR